MEWLKRLRGQTVGLDTAPLIFYIEEHKDYLDILIPFFTDLSAGEFRVVTSTVTLLEVLVQPLRKEEEALAYKYYDILLTSAHLEMRSVTFGVAQRAAELRARHGLKTPDAIQLATAIVHGASVFLTNDRDFPRIDGITVLRLSDIVKGD